ncbi:MAG: hypothetical protein HRT74_03840, partial [Flavobacteriales bacterium]|nr:hypothetical protein [Flavobacteriales bacterium]
CVTPTVDVTFQVDMSEQTVDPAGVHLAGSFQGWQADGTPMADQGNGIWSVTLPLAQNSNFEYKFINGNSFGQDEMNMTGCSQNNNRFEETGTSNQTLDVVCFDSCTICSPTTVNVTFQVDMSQENVSVDGVHLAGSFQGWQPDGTPMVDQGNGVWAVTVALAENSNFEYKYINGNVFGPDESVPGECAQNNNRFLNTTDQDETLSVVCFQSCAPCVPEGGCTDPLANNFDPLETIDDGSCTYTVTFQVDMSQFAGVFTAPEVIGTMNGFAYGSLLLSDYDFDNVFTGTTDLTNGQYEFLFAVDAGASQESFNGSESCTVNTEGFWNRVLVVNGETTYPVNCFGSCDACVPTASDVRITEVDVVNGEVTLTNFGTASQEVSTYWFCNFPQYSQLANETILSGVSLLDPGASVTYAWSGASGADGECAIYSVDGSYNDPNAIIDYMQWESANNQRASVGVAAGVGDDVANFVSGNSPYVFNGGSGDYGSTFWSGTAPVATYDITFQVDMSLEAVSPEGVRIAGNFNDPDGDGNIDNGAYPQWDPSGIQLSDANMDNIYDVTLTLADGFTYEYKFINGDEWGEDESVPGECQMNSNRFVTVNGADETLGVHCFASCDPCVFNDFTVTFQVDMSEQVVDGAGVHLAGSFNAWDPQANPMTDMGNGIWSADVVLTAGDVHTYQFVNGTDLMNAETVPVECGVDDGNGGYYREITVPAEDTSLDIVCFSSCAGCVSSVVNVTFQVDMSTVGANAIGVFIVGSFQTPTPWTAGADQMVDQGNDIYTFTASLPSGTVIEYKYLNGPNFFNEETVPSACGVSNGLGGFNRSHTVGFADETIDLHCFSSCVACDVPPINVTFQVDMSDEVVDPNGVHIAGDFQGWDPAGTPMVDQGNGIWTYTAMIEPNTAPQYKFINGNVWGQDEAVPGECSVGGNRELVLGDVDVTADLVCFGSCTVCNPPVTDVTFQVDMSNEVVDPNGVHLAGSFQGWDPAASPMVDQGNGIWSLTVSVAINSNFEYKFINGNTFDGAENVPNECAVNNNREVVVGDMPMTVPVVCFEQCDVCDPPTVNVTFQVDMSNDVVDPNGVHLAGSFQGWDPAANPMNDLGGGIWSLTLPVATNATYEYKFINGNIFDGAEAVPNECAVNTNREVTVVEDDVVIPVVCFEECDICITPQVTITFRVDMNNVAVSADGVHIVGNFQGWDPAASEMTLLGWGIYEYSVVLDANTTYFYKFINGDEFGEDEVVPEPCATENGFGSNNRELITSTEDNLLEIVCYQECDACAGCTDPFSIEYNPFAGSDDGSCATPLIEGCTYSEAENYSPTANEDNGTCLFDGGSSCPGDLNGDFVVNAADLLAFLGDFGTVCN